MLAEVSSVSCIPCSIDFYEYLRNNIQFFASYDGIKLLTSATLTSIISSEKEKEKEKEKKCARV